jgi:hypothetical protein
LYRTAACVGPAPYSPASSRHERAARSLIPTMPSLPDLAQHEKNRRCTPCPCAVQVQRGQRGEAGSRQQRRLLPAPAKGAWPRRRRAWRGCGAPHGWPYDRVPIGLPSSHGFSCSRLRDGPPAYTLCSRTPHASSILHGTPHNRLGVSSLCPTHPLPRSLLGTHSDPSVPAPGIFAPCCPHAQTAPRSLHPPWRHHGSWSRTFTAAATGPGRLGWMRAGWNGRTHTGWS